jgi:site-specific recombinase XerD
VFGRADGSPFGRTTILRMLDRTAKTADLCTTRKTVSVHLLRHSFASQAVLAGVPIRVVQAWLGHSEINQTMRYSHLSPDSHQGKFSS